MKLPGMNFPGGIFAAMQEYDNQQQNYIRHLEEENAKLQKKITEMTNLVVKGCQVRDNAMLELIVNGNLISK